MCEHKTYYGLSFGDGVGDIRICAQPHPCRPSRIIHDSVSRDAGHLKIHQDEAGLRFEHLWDEAIHTATFSSQELYIPEGLESPIFERAVGPVVSFLTEPRRICLHASAVLMDGLAWLMIGASGTGKSSTAWTLGEMGVAQFLCDDVVVLNAENGVVLPGPQVAWLRKQGRKERLLLPRLSGEFPLAGIVMLERGKEATWEKLTEFAATKILLASLFHLTEHRVSYRASIRNVVEVAKNISVFRFRFVSAESGEPEHVWELFFKMKS